MSSSRSTIGWPCQEYKDFQHISTLIPIAMDKILAPTLVSSQSSAMSLQT